jgi:D-alanine-D-alanine ligase
MSKLVIGWFFGGRSTEHEVSVVTAVQAYENLDKSKYEVIPIYVSKAGEFYTSPKFWDLKNYKDVDSLLLSATKIIMGTKDSGPRFAKASQGEQARMTTGSRGGFFSQTMFSTKFTPIDLAFPLFHGSFGEDGCVQGLFEMYGISYIGFGVTGSAVAMDKIIQKHLFQSLSLPVCKFATITRSEFQKNPKHVTRLIDKLNFPVFVKPATIGSSIGVQKAKNFDELNFAIEVAATYAEKILIEEDMSGFVEVNCSALGYAQSLKLLENKEVQASVCEMPKSSGEILSFQDKYQRGGQGSKNSTQGMASLQRIIPAPIKAHLAQKIQEATIKVFKALDGCGVARVDFFVDERRERFYVNEINTPPGSLAFYLWEKSEYFEGNKNLPIKLTYKKLLDLLIEFALERAENQKKTQYTFESGLLSQMAGVGGIKR